MLTKQDMKKTQVGSTFGAPTNLPTGQVGDFNPLPNNLA
jgi:hypothetical protein